MATSAKKLTNRISQIQSKAQDALNKQKEVVASSTEATTSGSTETPKVGETPKITQMAKAMPSITIPEIKPVEINTQANTQATVPVDVRSDVKDLFAKKTTPTLKKADTNLLSKDDSAVTPLDLVKASIKAGGQVEKEVDKITQSKVEDWLNSKWEENRKLREENTQSLFDFGGKTREATKEAFYSAEERINDTEYTIVKVSDIINEKMGGMGFLVNPMDLFLKGALGRDKSYTESFQEKQGWYWDTYAKESEIEAQQAYDKDETSQQITQDVSDFFYDITGNQEVSNMLGNVAGHTISTLKDPNQVAHVVGYMAPALLTAWAGGGGFLLNTSVWIPSQTTNVYKDFAEDPELSSQFTDDQLFGMSLGIGTLLSMVETFGDALGDMPWAKSMSRTIRQNFSRLISSNIKKGLSKEITDMVDISLVKDVKQPVLNALKKWFMGSIGEGVEEVTQDTIQTESARALGSKREGMTLENALTTFFVAQGMGLGIGGIGGGVNIKNNYDLKEEYKNFSNAVDDLAPGINEDTKMAFFSAIKTSQQKDADLSERTIARYEEQTTKLYEERSMLEQRLKQADNDEVRAKINGMIEQTDKKIKEIDKKINQWNNTRDEINKYIEEYNQQREEEELEGLHREVNNQIAKEGENLSEQTMKEPIQAEEKVKIPSTPEEYESMYLALRQPQNTLLKDMSHEELTDMKKDLMAKWERVLSEGDYKSADNIKMIVKMINNEIAKKEEEKGKKEVKIPTTPEGYVSLSKALKQPGNTYLTNLSEEQLKSLKKDVQDVWKYEGFFGRNNEAYRDLIKAINEELEQRRNERTNSSSKKLTFRNAQDFVNKMIEIDKKNGDWSKREDKNLREKYFGWFLRNNIEGDFSAHLPGLKGVNLKQIEWKLTDKNLRDIAEMIALVSKTFGVDFNKIINDSNISVNIANDQNKFLYNTGNYGLMTWMPTKEQVRDLIKRTGHGNMGLAGDIIKMGVAITLDRGIEWSGSTMAHELMHLLDFAISTEEGLPLKYDNGTDYTSSIEGDYDWKTFTVGTFKPKYYNRWTEILARYAQQYYSWKNHPDVFKKYCKKDWYWTENEFLKLVPKFESFIKDRLGAKLLDEENQFYYDIVHKINENKFATISEDFDREGLPRNDVEFKLKQIEEEYAYIMSHLNEMTGTLKEEMEAYVQMSNLQSNYEMAKAKGEEYLKMLKTTSEQQGAIDNITTNVLPPDNLPQDPNTINNGLPQLGGSNIENGIGNISEGGEGEQLGKSYMGEENRIKVRKRKNKIRTFRKELGQAWHDVITPAISRIYNISPRVAGRLITMETQTDINISRYRQKAKGFVDSMGKLKGKQALEVKKALLDYGALASEQGDNIEEYKNEEVAKLKEVLLRDGFKEKDIDDMFSVLDDIGRQYQEAGLSVTLSDMYFPRVVKDYEGLIDYMNRVSGKDIKVNKVSLMIKIKQIQQDPDLTEEEKEKRIRNAISTEFKQPGTTSQHGKERKLGLLSERGEGIYAYYENPIESLDHYIVTMTNAIQRQLFLGGLREDANIDSDIINEDTAESVSQIIGKLVEEGMVKEEDVEELQKSILAVLNKKPSPKTVTVLKDITYIATITNFLSAINQLDDLGMVILKDRSGLKHIVKTIFGKAGIKYDELGLEDSYEMFREEGGITNWLFKKSLFNFFDRIGKTSFINTAWESMVRQSKNEKTRKYLYTRLVSMYGQESADRMMAKIDSGDYRGDDGQIDIEILRDLLYQLGSTQPIYKSAMPTAYLNHPWTRLCYALSSFTLKRIDWLVQGTKEVYKENGGGAIGAVKAGAWLMYVSSFLAMFGTAIGDIGDYLKGKKEETFLWNLINKGIDEALMSGGGDALNSWLKIWDLSDYDIKLYKQQGLWGVFSSKIKPFIFDLGKDVTEAITEHNADEITDLAKYVPIFGKLVYYWCWEDLGEETKKNKDEWDFSDEEEWDFGGDDEWDFSGEEEWDFS